MTEAKTTKDAFTRELIALIPQMRAFARSLCRDHAKAEDLVQDALAKAWSARANFELGTNMRAWTFMILRNQFYSDKRRAWRWTELDPEVAERSLTAVTSDTATLELDEVRRALFMLADDQREALILIGAAGLSYDEASAICGVAIGTIKSRVSRARDRLALIFAEGSIPTDNIAPSQAMGSIFAAIDGYRMKLAG
ncbi:MAG: sigma-70 family RNA polymerase sigma factor [Caulobacteraceae bacterium]|nr:sigma-70 family RNA polymerase sigma factor [Caulobacteraceae bacterium]